MTQRAEEHGGRVVSVNGTSKRPAPQIYGSSDGVAIGGFATFPSKSAEDIAQEQFRLIEKTFADGKVGADEQYRLLLIGHSWGADKAVEVTSLRAS